MLWIIYILNYSIQIVTKTKLIQLSVLFSIYATNFLSNEYYNKTTQNLKNSNINTIQKTTKEMEL